MRPLPLRTDGSNAFARFSMQVRVPAILREVLARNPDYPAALQADVEALATSIEGDGPLPAPHAPAPDLPAWSDAFSEHAAETWLHAEWFHAELAVYRELASRTRFWETDRDPFAPAKEEELASERLWTRLEASLALSGAREERLAAHLDACLWGNRVDLSYAVASGLERKDEDLLVDDRVAAAALLATADRIAVLADNTGTELALDLALVDALLERAKTCVTIHLKAQPVFVSDALPRDVWRLVQLMALRGGDHRRLAERLRVAFDAGRLRLAPDPFWSGPRFLWQAPPHVARALAASSAVVVKGDANYRRVVGDGIWPDEATFAQASSYVAADVVCVRTLKSDALVGVPARLARELDVRHPTWRIDGRHGLVQSSHG